MKRIIGNDLARLMSYVTKTKNCWLTPAKPGDRFMFWFRGRLDMGHRVSYILHRREIPAGLEVCHTCDTPSCVNPEHLFLGTHLENMQDGQRKGRINQGSKHGMAVLTETQVIYIIRHGKRGESTKILAAKFGISERTIRRIKNRRGWKHMRAS